ncbi:hypothetical protein ABZ998_30600, partial [Streptomyces sp. NPDC046182]
IGHEVRTALERWEPRIEVDDVVVAFDAVDDGTAALRGTHLRGLRVAPRRPGTGPRVTGPRPRRASRKRACTGSALPPSRLTLALRG